MTDVCSSGQTDYGCVTDRDLFTHQNDLPMEYGQFRTRISTKRVLNWIKIGYKYTQKEQQSCVKEIKKIIEI